MSKKIIIIIGCVVVVYLWVTSYQLAGKMNTPALVPATSEGEALTEEPVVILPVVGTDITVANVFSLTNQTRQELGLALLRPNDILTRVAQTKCEDMATRDYFAHTDPDGQKVYRYIQGYDYFLAGENLAVNFKTIQRLYQAWLDSPTHKANIVQPQYRDMGVGIAKGFYKGNPDRVYACVVFGAEK